MRFRPIVQSCAALAFAVAAAPALAHDHPAPAGEPGVAPPGADMRPEWKGDHPQPHPGAGARARDEWLSECRRRISAGDNGLGGAVIGGVLGGFAGNRMAGRGNRTVGTVAGAAVGAIAGAAIDKAEDSGRARDECETYLDSYYDYYAQAGRGYYGYGYGHAAYAGGCCQPAPMMMVPLQAMPRKEPECTETVEYVTEYVPVRPKVRRIPAKRVKVVPDKRIPVK